MVKLAEVEVIVNVGHLRPVAKLHLAKKILVIVAPVDVGHKAPVTFSTQQKVILVFLKRACVEQIPFVLEKIPFVLAVIVSVEQP